VLICGGIAFEEFLASGRTNVAFKYRETMQLIESLRSGKQVLDSDQQVRLLESAVFVAKAQQDLLRAKSKSSWTTLRLLVFCVLLQLYLSWLIRRDLKRNAATR
jgi:hypothetical protein